MGLAAGEGARPTPPPARPPASPELPPTLARASSHWLRRAAAAARTGRPGCQSPAGGRGGAPCRGGFLFARASAGNNERDPPGARGPRRPGTRCRAPPTRRGPPARRGQRPDTAARRWRYPSSPHPPRDPAAVVPGGRRARAAIFGSLPAGAVTHGWRQPRLRGGQLLTDSAAALCPSGAKMSARSPRGSRSARAGAARSRLWPPAGRTVRRVSPGAAPASAGPCRRCISAVAGSHLPDPGGGTSNLRCL